MKEIVDCFIELGIMYVNADSKVEELQQRIDKAIEYIKQQNRFIQGCDINLITDWKYVLDILQGSDKE